MILFGYKYTACCTVVHQPLIRLIFNFNGAMVTCWKIGLVALHILGCKLPNSSAVRRHDYHRIDHQQHFESDQLPQESLLESLTSPGQRPTSSPPSRCTEIPITPQILSVHDHNSSWYINPEPSIIGIGVVAGIHCHGLSDHSDEGYLLLQFRVNATRSLTRRSHNQLLFPVLRGRVVGASVQELLVTHRWGRRSTMSSLRIRDRKVDQLLLYSYLHYTLGIPGNYSAYVCLLFPSISFNESDYQNTRYSPLAIIESFSFTHQTPHGLETELPTCRFRFSQQRGYFTTTTSYPWQPKWKMSHFIGDDISRQAATIRNISQLTYIPHTCRMKSLDQLRPCYSTLIHSNKKICLVGDSQTRHLHNAFSLIFNDTDFQAYRAYMSRRRGPHGRDGNDVTEKQVNRSIVSRFFEDNWGNCLRNDQTITPAFKLHQKKTFACVHDMRPSTWIRNCSVVVANFGQWDASWAGGSLTSTAAYEASVERSVSMARTWFEDITRQSGPDEPAIPFLWATVHPFGESSFLSYRGNDWRFHNVLADYAAASKRACQKHGVDYIDLFSVGSVLNDLAYDSFHFPMIIEKELASILLHEVCAYTTRGDAVP